MSAAALLRDAKVVENAAHRVSNAADFEQLLDLAGGAQIVLIGDASHGTHDFYATRVELSRHLIEKKGFQLIALEADWPDTLRVHRYVTGHANETEVAEALGDFRRFPAWMWRNTAMAEFVEWLRGWNLQPAREMIA